MTRVVSSICGLIAICIAIWLESHGMKVASQIFIWSVVALSVPVGMGVVSGELRETWFPLGLMSSVGLHILLVWGLRTDLPFPNALVAILIGGIESLGLAVIAGKIRDLTRRKGRQD